jgi:hypothetical protein
MTTVAGVLLDEMDHDPAQLHRLSFALTDSQCVERRVGCDSSSTFDFGIQHVERVGKRVIRQRVKVAVAIVRVVPVRGLVQSKEDLTKPILLHTCEVADQAEQGEVAVSDRGSGLRVSDPSNFADQHPAVVVEQPADDGAFIASIGSNVGIEQRNFERPIGHDVNRSDQPPGTGQSFPVHRSMSGERHRSQNDWLPIRARTKDQ